jgi:hypothetical protein
MAERVRYRTYAAVEKRPRSAGIVSTWESLWATPLLSTALLVVV